ncbi:MAG: hypothetical protein R3E95_11260 [Thiolinea sp.]
MRTITTGPGRRTHTRRPATAYPNTAQPARSTLQKLHPASRTERMASWHQRMQALFTRQTY